MNKVELRFQDKSISRGNDLVYPKSTAIEFIKECQKENIQILGVDAFIIKENFHQPSLDNSIDFTLSPYKNASKMNTWEIAIGFLNERNNEFFFEIVCDNP